MDTNDVMITKKKEKFRVGQTVFLLLAILTIGEFMIAQVGSTWTVVFVAISLFKAALVVRDYMHIGRLFATEEKL
jgi:hypothetical protein